MVGSSVADNSENMIIRAGQILSTQFLGLFGGRDRDMKTLVKCWSLLAFVTFATVVALAQQPQGTPLDMFNHLYWTCKGTVESQSYGYGGLSYLGRLSDSVQHAVAISNYAIDDGVPYPDTGRARASLVLNRSPFDTARVYEFPGQKAIRANFNGDTIPDFLVWGRSPAQITILFGTPQLGRFDTAAVIPINGNYWGMPMWRIERSIVVADMDSDGHDDWVFHDFLYDSAGKNIGRVLFFRGGPTMSSQPMAVLNGDLQHGALGYTGDLSVGHVRDKKRMYLCEHRVSDCDGQGNCYAVHVLLYPYGPSFHLQSTDTIALKCGTSGDSTFYGSLGNTGWTFDVDDDGIDDVLYSTASARLFACKGGTQINSYWTYVFPSPGGSLNFANEVFVAGDMTGHNYPSMIVTDPDGAGSTGMICLYNLGKAIKQINNAAAIGVYPGVPAQNHFGIQAIPLGDVSGDGLADIMLSCEVDSQKPDFTFISNLGQIFVFLGDPSYGPRVGVHEPSAIPGDLSLEQSFPNPAVSMTTIGFSAGESGGTRTNVSLVLFDLLGRERQVLYEGPADDLPRFVRFDVHNLPAGSYVYRLRAREQELSRVLLIMK
jgi:hypothetical protein